METALRLDSDVCVSKFSVWEPVQSCKKERFAVINLPSDIFGDDEIVGKIEETIQSIEKQLQVGKDKGFDTYVDIVKGEMHKKLKKLNNSKANTGSKCKSRCKPYWSPELQDMWDSVCELEERWLSFTGKNSNVSHHKHLYMDRRKQCDKSLRKSKRNFQLQKQQELHQLESTNKTKDFWKRIGHLDTPQIPMEVNGADGEIITDHNTVLNTWYDSYSNLYNTSNANFNEEFYSQVVEEVSNPGPVQGSDVIIQNRNINYTEVERAVLRLRKGKSVGFDDIPAEDDVGDEFILKTLVNEKTKGKEVYSVEFERYAWELNICRMDDGQGQTDDSETDDSTPAEYKTGSNGDTSSDEEHLEPAGIARGNPQGATEGADMEHAENRAVCEQSADEYSDGTDEEGDGIQDMSQLGAGAIGVKFQTVHQESYEVVDKDTASLAHHIMGCCQLPQGETAAAVQQQEQLQPSADLRTCLQVPGTAALTPVSTSPVLPRIPESVVSELKSSGLPLVPVSGGSSTVTQYNLIQVQQQFENVTVKGSKNLNIGGTQNVGTTPANQEEEEKSPTAAQRIRKRTTSRIQLWTKDMVETKALKKVKEKLDRGATWVTITGKPGEGKSTTAYMALNDLYSQGRQVYQVVSPAEFNEVIMTCSNPVILLDDIFGDLEFDAAELAKWKSSLRPIVDVKNPDQYVVNDPVDKSTKAEKVSERRKVDQAQRKQTSPNKDKTIIILVGRDYVLKSSLADLGRMADYISSPQYVVEVSSQRKTKERRKIWRVHAAAKNIDFEESVVSQICMSDCPHGFPYVCKLFVAAYEKDWTRLQTQMFFQAPLDFLRMTLDKFLQDMKKRSLFKAMIKRDGKISLQELEEDGSLGYECIEAADDLVGSYLKKEDDTYMFDHPSMYESVSFILSTKQLKFVIENCRLSFLHQRLRLSTAGEREENVVGETGLIVNIPWTYAGHLAGRFASEIEKCNLHVFSHQAFCNSDFVDLLMTRFHMCVADIVKLTDISSKQSFYEFLSSIQSHHLIKFFKEKENGSFIQSEGRETVYSRN
ncbi:uncharacterized protein [Haliotis asinina]|uniref:uncharacterized protein n=1 Tax=Haliotis asinina TaxID=109174 RepID=UPI0035319404